MSKTHSRILLFEIESQTFEISIRIEDWNYLLAVSLHLHSFNISTHLILLCLPWEFTSHDHFSYGNIH